MAIVCCTDFSAASSGALEVARALGGLRGDRDVVFVHAVGDDAEVARARTALDAQIEKGRSGPRIRGEVVVGTSEALGACADREHADLIVIAAASRPGS